MTKRPVHFSSAKRRQPKAFRRACDHAGRLGLSVLLAVAPASQIAAQSITLDGRTATTLSGSGSVTDITTGTVSGGYGVNAFDRFGVEAGRTVNIHAPTGTQGTVNLVTGGRTVIDGTLRGMRNGQVGGALYMANPDGFSVGANGEVLAGRIGLSTPTRGFVQGAIGPGGPNADAIAAIAAGTDPQGAGGIDVAGRVAAGELVRLRTGGDITLSGQIEAGARAGVIAAAVNTGTVEIDAGGRLDLARGAQVRAGGAETGGVIGLHAGGDITLDWGAVIGAEGLGAGDGGTAVVFAEGSAWLGGGAVVSAAALGAGDGGFVEFSAVDVVEIAGDLQAWSAMGKGGTVLIDPTDLVISTNVFQNGANYIAQASNAITVNPGVIISTRNIGTGTDQFADPSQGDSGNIRLEAPAITIGQGAALLAFSDDPSTSAAGNILLDAHEVDTTDLSEAAGRVGRATINVDGAILWGRNITLQATVMKDEAYSAPGAVIDYVTDTFGTGGTGVGFIDRLLQRAVTRADTRVATLLGELDTADLPAFLDAEARVNVSGSYVIASGDAAFVTNAITDIDLDPADQTLAIALAKSRTVAETHVTQNLIQVGGELTVAAFANEQLDLAAGGTNPDAGSALAMAISLREAKATAVLAGSSWGMTQYVGLPTPGLVDVRVRGAINVNAGLTKSIDIAARSGAGAGGNGEAVILSFDDSAVHAGVAGIVIVSDDAPLTIDAATNIGRYDLEATVSEEGLGNPPANDNSTVDQIAAATSAWRSGLAGILGLGDLIDGAALIFDEADSATAATFATDIYVPDRFTPFQGGIWRATLPASGALASDGTIATLRAVTDIGTSSAEARVGTPSEDGTTRGGTAILSDQERETVSDFSFGMIENAPDLVLEAILEGSYAMNQETVGGTDTAFSFGRLATDFNTVADVEGLFGFGGGFDMVAREALELKNRQSANTFADGSAGTYGIARTAYGSTVQALVENSDFGGESPRVVNLTAESGSTLETVAMRNGETTEDKGQGAAASAYTTSSGMTEARMSGNWWIKADALNVTATDRTWRETLANSSAEGDGRNLLGALARDAYERDTRAIVEQAGLEGMANGLTISALSESQSNVVAIGRAAGGDALGLALLGAKVRDDRDVIALFDPGESNMIVSGDVEITATRQDRYILLKGTEASGGQGVGLAYGEVALGGETRAEADFDMITYVFEGDGDGECGVECEFASTASFGGDMTITATNAAKALDISLGAGTSGNWGGAGAVSYIDMGHLAEDKAIVGVTDALLDSGSERADYSADLETIRTGFSGEMLYAGGYTGFAVDESDVREAQVIARLGVSDGTLDLGGNLTVAATDQRRATAVAGQLQAGVVAPATGAFTSYFSIDDITENGVEFSLRPESLGEAVSTAGDVISTGIKASQALGDFSDAIKDGAGFSTESTTIGAAIAVTVIGGAVAAEIDLRPETESAREGLFSALGAVDVAAVNDAGAAALGFGLQVGSSSYGASIVHARLNQLGSARIIAGAVSAGRVSVAAETTGFAKTIGGVLGVATNGTAAGLTVALTDMDAAALAEITAAQVTSSGGLDVAARDTSRALSVALAGGGSAGPGALVGAIGATSQRALVQSGAIGSTLTNYGGDVTITATQNALTNAMVAQGGAGGTFAAGAAIADVTLRSVTLALAKQSTIDAFGIGSDLVIAAHSERTLGALAAGGNAGGSVGVTGSIALVTREDVVRAQADDADLHATDSLLVEATASAGIGTLGGGDEARYSGLGAGNVNIALGGSVGIGVSVSVLRSLATVEALVTNSTLTTAGHPDNSGVSGLARSALDGYAGAVDGTYNGIAVVADNETRLDILAMSANVAGATALSAQVPVVIIADTVVAEIAGGSAGSAADIHLNAANRSDLRLLSLLAQGSGTVSGGVDIEVIQLAKSTTARTTGATLSAERDIGVLAAAPETISTWSAAFGVSGTVAATGVIQSMHTRSATGALVDGGSLTTANGGVSITAVAPRAITQTAVNVTVSGTVGAGATVLALTAEDEVLAEVVDSTALAPTVIDTGMELRINAEASLDAGTTVMGGTGGVVGLSGAFLVARSHQQVTARLGDFTRVTGSGLRVDAFHRISQSATVGNVTGAGLAIGAAVLSLSGANDVLAEVGFAANVDVGGLVEVTAEANRDVIANSVAIGGGGFSYQGAATLLGFGADLSDGETDETISTVYDDLANPGALGFDAGDGATGDALADAIAARQAVAAIRAEVAADSVMARIDSGARIEAQGSITVSAEETGTMDASAGSGSVGPVAFAAGFTRTRLGTQVRTEIGTSTRLQTASGDITLRARSDVDTGTPTTFAGSGGAAAGFGALTETHANRLVVLDVGVNSYIGDGGAGTATITLEAEETGSADAKATGAGVGAAAVGGVFATARNSSSVSLILNESATLPVEISGGEVVIGATRAGSVEARGVGLAGGVVAGAGVDVAAYDSSVTSVILGNAQVAATGDVTVSALAGADVLARGEGAAVGLGAVGVTLARAERAALVEIAASGLDLTAGSLDITALDALSTASADASTLTARTFSATGGAAAAVGGAVTTLDNLSEVVLAVTFAALDVAGDAALTAGTNAALTAKSTGLVGGFAAAGANLVRATSSADAALAANVAGPASVGGDLALMLTAADDATLGATSGAGGIYAAFAADSDYTVSGTNTLTFDAGSGVAVGGTLSAALAREVAFANESDSLRAALAGFGGTRIDNAITTTSTLTLLGAMSAAGYDIALATDVTKTESGYSGVIGSVGVLDGSSLKSETDVTTNATLAIADGASLTQIGSGGIGNVDTLIALTGSYDLADSVKIDTGSAIAVPSALSRITLITPEAAIRIGDASLRGDSGIEIGVLSDVALDSEAYVNVYGVAGSPYAETRAEATGTQIVALAAGASIVSDKGSVTIGAGSAESGGQATDVSTELRVWNATALPIGRTPYAVSRAELDNVVTMAAGAEVRAGNDVRFNTGAGAVDLYSYGLASDLYREAAEDIANAIGSVTGADEVSLDTEVGVVVDDFGNRVTLNGIVEAGSSYFQELIAGDAGIVTVTDGIDAELIEDADLRAELEAALAQLEADLAALGNDSLIEARLGYEIARLESILANMGTNPINLLRINDAFAAPGDVFVTADTLNGSGTVIAHGDATIQIVNEGPAVIEVVDATIPYVGGGLVTLNDIPLTAATAPDNLTIQATSSAGVAAEPLIAVENRYATSTGISGDVYITGSIENLRGRVSVFTADGDIMVLGGEINAAVVDISSGGDFFLSAAYDDAVVNPTASAFATHAPVIADVSGSCGWITCEVADLAAAGYGDDILSPSQIIASGNVYIYANGHVNINGLIQSGITDYEVTIYDNIVGVLDDLPRWQDIPVLYSPAGNGTSPAEDPLFPAAAGNVTLRYDRAAEAIVIDPIVAKGGLIEIVGQIMSTGGGELRAAHGFAQVDILNESDIPIVLSDISTGFDEGAVGQIRIVDLGRPAASGDGYVVTDYALAPNGTVTKTTTGAGLFQTTMLDAPTYEITEPLRLVIASGEVLERADGTYEMSDTPGMLFDRIDNYLEYGSDLTTPNIIVVNRVPNGDPVILNDVEYFDEYVLNANDNDFMAVFDDYLGFDYFADLIAANDYVFVDSAAITAFDPYRVVTSDWVPLTAPGTYYRIYSEYHYTSEYDLHVLAADKPIDIGFHGNDTGRVTIDSAGDVVFNGQLYNRSGPTTVISSGGSIIQNQSTLPFETNKLTLDAAGEIGAARVYGGVEIDRATVIGGLGGGFSAGGGVTLSTAAPVLDRLADASLEAFRIDQDTGFGLDVVAGGSARVEEVLGDMELLEAWAQGDLVLTAADSILIHRFSATPVVAAAGDRLRLTTTAGSIGTSDAPITFDTPILTAVAGGDINLLTISDQPVKLRQVISATGDVSLASLNSPLWDWDFTTRIDRRAQDGLLETLWDELGLRAVDSAGGAETGREAAVLAAFEDAQTASYFEYWNERRSFSIAQDGTLVEGAPLPYDPAYVVRYDATERAALEAAGLSAAEISAKEAEATARFHALHETWDGAFDVNYRYAATTTESGEITTGLHWTDAELGLGLRRSLILPVTDTEPEIEDPNVAGNVVNLAGTSIGRTRAPYVIDRDAGLTEEALTELWTAERIDLTVTPTTIEIARAEDLDVEATGHLVALAPEDVFIGSEGPLAILSAVAGGQMRIKSGDALSRAPDGATLVHLVSGTDIVLEAAAGGIGVFGEPILINQLEGGTVTARADGAIRLTAPLSDITVSEVFSDAGVVLASVSGSIMDAGNGDGIDILADNLVLFAGGAIGTPGDPLDVELFGASGNISAIAVTGGLDLSAWGGDVTAGVIGSVASDATLSVPDGDLILFGLADPALAALFAPEALATAAGLAPLVEQAELLAGDGLVAALRGTPSAGEIDSALGLLTGVGGSRPLIEARLDAGTALLDGRFQGLTDALAASGLAAAAGGLDTPSSAENPAVPALHAGGVLTLAVAGSVVGRDGAALDLQAKEGAVFEIGGDLGAADNMILASLPAVVGQSQTVTIRDYDQADGVAANAYLAALDGLTIGTVNLAAGESIVRVLSGGDLVLNADSRVRAGVAWLGAVSAGDVINPADILIEGAPVLELDRLGLVSTSAVRIDTADTLAFDGTDLTIIASVLNSAAGCTGCGTITLAGDHRLSIVAENVIDLAAIAVDAGEVDLTLGGAGWIELDSLSGDRIDIASRLGIIDIAELSGGDLAINGGGIVTSGTYALTRTIDIDALAIGADVTVPLEIVVAGTDAPTIELAGDLALVARLSGAEGYTVDSLAAGSGGVGIIFDAVTSAGRDLTLQSVTTTGAPVSIAAGGIALAGDIITEGGDVTLDAGEASLSMLPYTEIDAGTGSIRLTSERDITIAALRSMGGAQAAANIYIAATEALTGVAAYAPNVSAAAYPGSSAAIYAGAITNAGVEAFWVDARNLDLFVTSMDVHVISTIDTNITRLANTGGGDIEFLTLGDITLDDAVLTAGVADRFSGNLSLASAYGSIGGSIASLVGDEVSLLALGGSLGTVEAPVTLPGDDVGRLRALAQGEIALDIGGGLAGGLVVSETGAVTLVADDAITLDGVAGATVAVTSPEFVGSRLAEGFSVNSAPTIAPLVSSVLYRDVVAGSQSGSTIIETEVTPAPPPGQGRGRGRGLFLLTGPFGAPVGFPGGLTRRGPVAPPFQFYWTGGQPGGEDAADDAGAEENAVGESNDGEATTG